MFLVRLRWEIEQGNLAAGVSPVARVEIPTVDNPRNLLLTTTTEVLSFFQQLREAPVGASSCRRIVVAFPRKYE